MVVFTRKNLLLWEPKMLLDLIFQRDITRRKENCSGFPNISFIHGDAHSIPYPDETFDIVISRAVIHHLQDIPTFLREASRILKKNGVLILQDRTIEDCTIPGSPEHIRGYFFSVFPKLIEIESKRRPKTATIQQELQKHSLHVFPSQTQWEVRKIHDSVAALLQDLSPRTGRSILYELTDHELAQLLHHIQIALQNISPIIERDRWTIWRRQEIVRKEASQMNVRLPSFII